MSFAHKDSARRALRERRCRVSGADAQSFAERATAHLLETETWRNADSVAVYFHRDGEMSTEPLIDAARRFDKALYLPVIHENALGFRLWSEGSDLIRNRYGIDEPAARTTNASGDAESKPVRLDLLLTPLVGWAWGGYRLGMGGGYFDRYLANGDRRPGLVLGLAYACQREDSLAALADPWDREVDGVLTEQGLHRF